MSTPLLSQTHLVYFVNFKLDLSVTDANLTADRHCCRQILVVAGDFLTVALNCEVSANLNNRSLLEVDWLVVFECACADFGAFGLQHQCDCLIWALLESVLQRANKLTVRFMVALRKVYASHIHAGVDHFDQLVHIVA